MTKFSYKISCTLKLQSYLILYALNTNVKFYVNRIFFKKIKSDIIYYMIYKLIFYA